MKTSLKFFNRPLPGRAMLMLLLAARLTSAADEFDLNTALSKAKQGDAKVAYALARHYAKGEGVPQDDQTAAQYMRQAADLGYAFAQNDLGACYAKGQGVKQDFAEAAKWYLKAAENGDSLAQCTMGRICLEGRGVPKDVKEGVKWLKKSAAQNEPEAMLALGNLYFKGAEGIAVDCQEAGAWFQKAVAQGRIEALNSLGAICERGCGDIGQNPEKAMNYYRAAAEKGDALGQMNLGNMYMEGNGVKFDLVEAYKWFYLSSKNGNLIANHYLTTLEGNNILPSARLTPEQINEAIRQANELDKAIKLKKRKNSFPTASRVD